MPLIQRQFIFIITSHSATPCCLFIIIVDAILHASFIYGMRQQAPPYVTIAIR